MGLFENFPYTNLHDLNLDWILGEVKKLLETQGYSPDNPPPYPVTSVNGKQGAVILFNEQEGAYIRFPDSENNQWNIYRLVNGVEAGIQFSATLPAKRMQGANRFAIYDEGNQPPYPVVSVNGKTGAVVLFNDQEGAYIRFPDSENTQWNVYRIIDGQANGIQFQKNGPALRMQGNSRFAIYDEGNQPPYPVTSVNGQTGAAETPFTDHTDDVLEFIAGAVGAQWGLKRTINTGAADEAEIEFTLQINDDTGIPEAFISSGDTIKKLLTENDIPSSSGVVSVNGQTGIVSLTGSNLAKETGSQETVAQAIASQNDNIANLRSAMTYVVDGNKSARTIPAGAYFQLVNSSITGRSDGAYTASQAIPANTVIDSTYFTQTAPISEGALNHAVSVLNSKITNKIIDTTTMPTVDQLKAAKTIIVFCQTSDLTSNGAFCLRSYYPNGILLTVWNGVSIHYTQANITWDKINGTISIVTNYSDRGSDVTVSIVEYILLM